MRIMLRVLGILVLIGGGISAYYNSIILFEGEPYVKKAYTRAHNKAKALEQEIQTSGASAESAGNTRESFRSSIRSCCTGYPAPECECWDD